VVTDIWRSLGYLERTEPMKSNSLILPLVAQKELPVFLPPLARGGRIQTARFL
jgi:hypothetical protein